MIKETKFVSESELLQVVSGIDKPTFINMTTEIVEPMNKTGNPYFNKVTKVTTCNYLIGSEYENRVNNNDKKEGGEGTFESSFNRVGEHISRSLLFNRERNQHYVMVEFFPESKPKSEFYFEGNSIERTMLESWLKKKNEGTSQPQERKVLVRSFKSSSIKEMTYEGVRYVKV
jgi:hypothetical protein